MFALIPLELTQRRSRRSIPLANLCLIGLNIVAYLFMCLFGWFWTVGPGTGPLSILLYGFSHAGFWHLLFNMWALWVFGNPVNRRLGNGYYLIAYLGTIVVLGLIVRLCFFGPVIGASGGVFAVIIIACMLMPAEKLLVAYGALFPLTLLIGLLSPPRYAIYWFIRGGQFAVKAVWCLLFIPLLEVLSLLSSAWTGQGGVWNFGHLLGMFCGVIAVLMLPTSITMNPSVTMGRY